MLIKYIFIYYFKGTLFQLKHNKNGRILYVLQTLGFSERNEDGEGGEEEQEQEQEQEQEEEEEEDAQKIEEEERKREEQEREEWDHKILHIKKKLWEAADGCFQDELQKIYSDLSIDNLITDME
jgi:hypothetical protein